jgi:AraC-like DNA-binding protein/mannose-6-phosphate isomerase-like protein (cupin superfamily)
MAKRSASIPVIAMPKTFDKGIAVRKMSSGNAATIEDADHSHRHDFHFFILQEAGRSHIEIDFKKYQLKKTSIIYIHPSQVHLLTKVENADLYLLAVSDENIDPRYLKLLEEMAPISPLALKTTDFSLLTQAVSLCIDLFERKDDRLYSAILKDSCNTLIGLIVAQYLQRTEPAAGLSRFETVTREFRQALELHFIQYKRPSEYARILNISAAYLNECVKMVTGSPVSHHIQQRVILEAKRMLYHSGKSVKEISAELGYEDYPYFSRLFTKVAGISALTFRNKNLD